MKIVLESKGDNNWKESFDDEQSAYWFLYGIVSEKERYFSCRKHDHQFAFDCEDDIITWSQNGKKKYCAGWHWSEYSDKEQIIMPDGKKLITLMYKIEDQ